jgi:lipopolysaccharide exporter
VFGVIQALQTNIGYIYLATGKPQLMAMLNAVQFVLLLVFIVPGVIYYGATGAAWAFLLSAILMLPINQACLARYLALGYLEFGARIARPLLASLLMVAAVLGLRASVTLPPSSGAYLAMLLAAVALGALVYGLTLLALWIGAGRPAGSERFLFGKVQGALAKAGIRLPLVD